jgi:hypothetical protein
MLYSVGLVRGGGAAPASILDLGCDRSNTACFVTAHQLQQIETIKKMGITPATAITRFSHLLTLLL